ncbi:MAG: hypothetical protein KF861_11435 [Planctomycetaceae bacterium]|nr:hypothetical protein [Planctomycetaceae bacterium]
MKSASFLVVAVVIAALSGWAHGLVIDRWGTPDDLKRVAEQVEKLDVNIEGWTHGGDLGIRDQVRKAAGAEGYFSRNYTHDATGTTVQVTVLCGRPGPISLHTPDVCFVNAGMVQQADPTPTVLTRESTGGDVDDVPARFYVTRYAPPPSHPGPMIKTLWAWSNDGQSWSIPENPRLHFSREPYLYRLYFTTPQAPFNPSETDEEEAKGPVDDFLPEFLNRFAAVTRHTPE